MNVLSTTRRRYAGYEPPPVSTQSRDSRTPSASHGPQTGERTSGPSSSAPVWCVSRMTRRFAEEANEAHPGRGAIRRGSFTPLAPCEPHSGVHASVTNRAARHHDAIALVACVVTHFEPFVRLADFMQKSSSFRDQLRAQAFSAPPHAPCPMSICSKVGGSLYIQNYVREVIGLFAGSFWPPLCTSTNNLPLAPCEPLSYVHASAVTVTPRRHRTRYAR